MLKLSEIRKTTRGTSTAGLRTVHPHFLRDRALQPRIELAMRYLDSMVGHARSGLDPEVVVQLFGDHKLARGITAALAGSYAFRQLMFADVLDEGACARLAERGLTTASELRLWLFRRANVAAPGFVRLVERPNFLEAAAGELSLSASEVERLMTLDAAANAVLFRVGAAPRAEDVVARFNFQVASGLLANSSLIRVALRRTCAEPEAVRELCALAGVRAELSARELVLHGRQDVFGGWARYGARLARLVAELLLVGLPARSLEAIVEAGESGQWLFKADDEILAYSGIRPANGDTLWSAAGLLQAQRQLDPLLAAFGGLRRIGMHRGWLLKRAAEPIVTARGALPLLATATRGQERIVLVPVPARAGGPEGVAGILGHQAYLALDVADGAARAGTLAPGHVIAAATREDVELVPHLLDLALEASSHDAELERWAAIFSEVERAGVLTEARMAARLACAEEAVAGRVEMPAIRQEREARAIRYVEGFGLCTHKLLSRARDAAREVAALRGDEPVGPAWTARVLGRRLREVTGASEGIECLIAYLGAA